MTKFSFDKYDGELWVSINLQRFSHYLTKDQAKWLKEELEHFIEWGEEEETEED
jgi:hypothetical protein